MNQPQNSIEKNDQSADIVKAADNDNIITMPAIALRGSVMFPKIVFNLDIGRKKSILALNAVMKGSHKIFLVAQKNISTNNPEPNELYDVGVVAEVKQIMRSSGDTVKALVEGIYRAKASEYITDLPYLCAKIQEYPVKKMRIEKTALCDALMRTVKSLVDEYCNLMPKMPKDLILNIISVDDPTALTELVAGNLNFTVEDKQRILKESNIIKRLELINSVLEKENSILSLEKDIFDKVKEQMDKNQRDYFLHEQMKAISEELGEGETVHDEVEEYIAKIKSCSLEKKSEEKLIKEAEKLYKMPDNSHEAGVIRGYLDCCLDLPWNKRTVDKLDIKNAKKVLDRDHYGLVKVKERILEMMAVRKLAPNIKGQILCLVGPPGVGKTSVAKSIATAMGRKYARVSLGGMHDESDIRGHRKTYIGSMPGRIINAVKLANTRNPLILLDEIDKMGNDFKGDPSSAMLEVLDPEQNSAFCDHYIEIPFDLSEVLFITTANTTDTIPAPLRDRMEIIELTSYSREEKFHIIKKFLIPKQIKRHGLSAKTIKISDDAIYSVTDFYTREAGVREANRTIASICRKVAKSIASGEEKCVSVSAEKLEAFLGPKKFRPEFIEKTDEIGLVNGLAWTSVGGEILQIELSILEGSGKIELTGSLGDVMKESAKLAVSYVRAHCLELGISPDFYKTKDIHLHAPEGAVPKDGPSAGVTMCVALVSALTEIPVKRDIAMTGEISLHGKIMPIGGLKEKAMAAYRAGVTTVLIPKDNHADLADVDPEIIEHVKFIEIERISQALDIALVSIPKPLPGTVDISHGFSNISLEHNVTAN